MANTADQTLSDVLVVLVTLIVTVVVLAWLLGRLGRGRPALSIGAPIAAALVIRIAAAAALSLTAAASELRGGDELSFLARAESIAGTGFGSDAWTEALVNELHVFGFAVQMFVLDSPDLALRTAQAGIAVAAIALLATAVYELAGGRAAVVAAWVLAFEPTGVFFSTLLHKEPNMMLAGGLVALGGATMWKRGDLRSLIPIAAGCLIAFATRSYIGWFLAAAAAAIALHAALRMTRAGSARALEVRTLFLIILVTLLAVLAAPSVWQASSPESLEDLQTSQDANATDASNLKLERVDYSTRSEIVVNMPGRVVDVVTRPYPWELANVSQQLGLMGTLVVLVGLVLLGRELVRNSTRVMARAGPLIYLGLFLLAGYALSAGNAGTAFRYREHVVALGICIVSALAAGSTQERETRRPATQPPRREVALGRGA
jgi:hypothetical protein